MHVACNVMLCNVYVCMYVCMYVCDGVLLSYSSEVEAWVEMLMRVRVEMHAVCNVM